MTKGWRRLFAHNKLVYSGQAFVNAVLGRNTDIGLVNVHTFLLFGQMKRSQAVKRISEG